MRQWRVGTLSGGLLLIFTGSALLYAQFNKLAVIDTTLKWWPVLFILLGVEVLVHSYLRQQDNNQIKYDILSIIIILFIVLTGVGIQSFRELGLAEKIRTEISSQVFNIQDSQQIPLDAAIQKVVLETGGSQISIHSTNGNSIVARSSLQVRAQSQNQARNFVKSSQSFSQDREGNILYIHFNSGYGSRSLMGCDYSLIIPTNVAVEMELEGGPVSLHIDSINNNWDITGPGSCQINLPAESDLIINALLNNQVSVQGNLTWTKTNVVSPSNKDDNTPEPTEELVQMQTVLGKGVHKMNIRQVDELKFYRL
ncbi:MAG: hypothetical protein ABFC94_11210 [Syntrophomonas sp.]